MRGWHVSCLELSSLRRSNGAVKVYQGRSGMVSKLARSVFAAGAGAVLAIGIAGQGAAQTPGREVVLGAIVPSSGPFAEWGRTNTVTLQMLEKQVNDAGGVNGAKLRIIIVDD